jgi:uncharacterized protein (DUF111 family)
MPGGYETDTVTRLETNLDDSSPEILGAVMDQLLTAGALDVWFTPIHMKKNRPGVMLSLLCEETGVEALADIIFHETREANAGVKNRCRRKSVEVIVAETVILTSEEIPR